MAYLFPCSRIDVWSQILPSNCSEDQTAVKISNSHVV